MAKNSGKWTSPFLATVIRVPFSKATSAKYRLNICGFSNWI
jgi:hypothetical protein